MMSKLVPASKVLAFVVPVSAASGVLYFLQRHHWPLGPTLNDTWYSASEKYMEALPRQGSDTPVRINPFSKQINMHSVTF